MGTMAGATIKQILTEAEAAETRGERARAAELYREILARMPKHSRAKKALARLEKAGGTRPRMTEREANALVALLNRGHFAGVEAMAGELHRRFREEPFVWNVLGFALTQLGRDAEAAKAYRQAIRLDPNFVEALGNLGALLVRMGKPEEAAEVLRKALAKRPTYHEAHHNLGIALASMGRTQEALRHYDRAIELKPDYANALNSRGQLKLSTGDLPGAIADLRAALKLLPGDRVVIDNLSEALAQMGDVESALAFTEQLLAKAPDDVELLRRRAIQLNTLGRLEEAREAFRRLAQARPGDGEAMGTLLKVLPDEAERASLREEAERRMADPQTETRDKVLLGFALAADAERRGDAAAAGHWLDLANATYRASLPPLPVPDAVRFAQAREMFAEGVPEHLRGAGHPSERPIFIVGMMRSGTTLVEQIIASHSQVFGAGELEAATVYGTPVMEKGRKAKPEDIRAFAENYLGFLDAIDTEHPRVADKMPANFFLVGLLHTAFPNARIINTVRDPRDTCFSIWKNFFDTHAHQYAYDLAELAAFANEYKRLMNFWDEVLPEGTIYHIRYEDLVADQEAESRRLLDHLGLPWEDSVLEFHKTRRAVRTASVNQVRQKIYRSSVRSWEPFAEHLRPLLEGLDRELWKDAMVG